MYHALICVCCETFPGLCLPSFPQHSVTVRYATEHRCGVAVSGPGLTDAISGTDPLKDNLPLQACLIPSTEHWWNTVGGGLREVHALAGGQAAG